MRPTRTFPVAASVLLAALIPPAAGGAQALATALGAAAQSRSRHGYGSAAAGTSTT